ncbi:hypothetical protein SSS_08113 [Sarcoptes scabiei]|uniref:Uncharacterized protein n=1 Tax=Sarcoptes scabiei TaxID=52283 RepID=A0A834RHV4_SARSC|nr:hypothetical protein SSS_08113 [Sarcoptes scabiei]
MSFASQHGGSGDHFMATNNFSNKGPMVPIRPMKENETIQSFIRIFDNWAKANCWDDQESARIFKALIEDDQISSKIEKCSGNESFENIKKDLLTISKSARDRKFIELRSLKLGIEDDVDNLYHQISKLIDDCYNERVDPNQLKRDFFLSSIDARIRSKLFINQELPDDIIDLKNLVKGLMVIEKEITTKSLPKKSNNGGKCRYNSKTTRKFKKECGTAAKNATLSIIGKTNAKIKIGEFEFEHHLFISDDINYAILGMDIFNRLKMSLKYGGQLEFIANDQIHSIQLIQEGSTNNLCMSINEIETTFPEDLSSEVQQQVSEGQNEKIKEILEDYSGIETGIGRTNSIEHVIELNLAVIL